MENKKKKKKREYLLHFMPSRYNLIPVTGLFPTVTCIVFMYSLGPIKLKQRAGDATAIFAVGPSGRSLWIGAHDLCTWNSRKYRKSDNGGLSASHRNQTGKQKKNINMYIYRDYFAGRRGGEVKEWTHI